LGEIVNDEWFQGLNNKDICGYFPRAFVSIRKYVGRFKANFRHQLNHQVRIESAEFKDDIHVDDPTIDEPQVHVKNGGSSVKVPPKPILTSLQRLFRIISRLFPSNPQPPNSDRPDLPPSPVPAPPAFDKIVDGNRGFRSIRKITRETIPYEQRCQRQELDFRV
jgi:hypothetical protein